MKNILIGLIWLFIIVVGIFVYVKIKDNDSIDNLNILNENYRTGTEQLLTENKSLREYLIIHEARIAEIEEHSVELGRRLIKSEQYSAELERQLADGIERSLIRTGELTDIIKGIEKGTEEGLQIIRELKEYDFTE